MEYLTFPLSLGTEKFIKKIMLSFGVGLFLYVLGAVLSSFLFHVWDENEVSKVLKIFFSTLSWIGIFLELYLVIVCLVYMLYYNTDIMLEELSLSKKLFGKVRIVRIVEKGNKEEEFIIQWRPTFLSRWQTLSDDLGTVYFETEKEAKDEILKMFPEKEKRQVVWVK